MWSHRASRLLRALGTGPEYPTTGNMLANAFGMTAKQAADARLEKALRMYGNGTVDPPATGEVFLKHNPSLFKALRTPTWFNVKESRPPAKLYNLQYLSRLFVQFAHQNVKLEGNKLSEGDSWEIVKEMYGTQEFYFELPGLQAATAKELKHVASGDRDTAEFVDQLRAIQQATTVHFEDLTQDTLTNLWESTIASDRAAMETSAYPFRQGEMLIRGSPTVFPRGIEVPALMNKYFEWLKNEGTRVRNDPDYSHPILFAAEVFSNLTRIHPFKDGNGRISRVLMALCLTSFGYPPVVYVDMDRTEYLRSVFELVQDEPDYFLKTMWESIRGDLAAISRA